MVRVNGAMRVRPVHPYQEVAISSCGPQRKHLLLICLRTLKKENNPYIALIRKNICIFWEAQTLNPKP